jgi:hypothetical protein
MLLSWLPSKLWNQTGIKFIKKELLQNCEGTEEEVNEEVMAASLGIKAGE